MCLLSLQAFATANLLPYLHFWRAVEDYKFIPIGQVIFIQSRAEKVRGLAMNVAAKGHSSVLQS